MAMMNCSLNDNLAISTTTTGNSLGGCTVNVPATAWGYWQDWYYPQVIKQSYPVYIQEQSQDKGKKAFEIIKILKDKKLVNLEKVSNFIDLMDELIKIL